MGNIKSNLLSNKQQILQIVQIKKQQLIAHNDNIHCFWLKVVFGRINNLT